MMLKSIWRLQGNSIYRVLKKEKEQTHKLKTILKMIGDSSLVFVLGNKQSYHFLPFLFIIIFVVSQVKYAHWIKIEIHEKK